MIRFHYIILSVILLGIEAGAAAPSKDPDYRICHRTQESKECLAFDSACRGGLTLTSGDGAAFECRQLRPAECEALEELDLGRIRSGGAYDLVVSDIFLDDGSSGFELWELCRERQPEVPFVLISGMTPDIIGMTCSGSMSTMRTPEYEYW